MGQVLPVQTIPLHVLGGGQPLSFDGGFDFPAQSGHPELPWMNKG